ncbi:G patch domain-containing protein 4 [Battus philenor]|uniref:G patch domain-containing protein 4 n=1 Tax=Battus philenor TaxID=42288 RepID=UPI0035CEDE9A
MDFARKQLEKYGWTAGKGLGKHENGISEALKPKLKRSVAGVGHDAASDFTEHWWKDLYNKAAGNIEVVEVNGKTSKIKQKDNSEFEITNNAWRIKKKEKGEKLEQAYSDFFVKKAILGNGGSKVENIENDSEEEEKPNNVIKISDEELFAACEGRTAHKGARHGLKALGKLARIEQQEQILLSQAKYIGYSTAKKEKKNKLLNFEDSQINTNEGFANEVVSSSIKTKKKKRSHCQSEKNTEHVEIPPKREKNSGLEECREKNKPNNNKNTSSPDANDKNVSNESKKKKSKTKNVFDSNTESFDCNEVNRVRKKSKEKAEGIIDEFTDSNIKHKRKKKKV